MVLGLSESARSLRFQQTVPTFVNYLVSLWWSIVPSNFRPQTVLGCFRGVITPFEFGLNYNPCSSEWLSNHSRTANWRISKYSKRIFWLTQADLIILLQKKSFLNIWKSKTVCSRIIIRDFIRWLIYLIFFFYLPRN